MLDHVEERLARSGDDQWDIAHSREDVLDVAGPLHLAEICMHDDDLRIRHAHAAQGNQHRLAVLPCAVVHCEQRSGVEHRGDFA